MCMWRYIRNALFLTDARRQCIWFCNSTVGKVLYSHSDINHNSNTNRGGLFRFGYERVYSFLASVYGDTRRETQFLKANANHTMLTIPQRVVHFVIFKILILLCRSRSEKLNLHASTAEISTTVFSKSSNSQDHLFWAWHHPLSSLISCLGFIMTDDDCRIISARA